MTTKTGQICDTIDFEFQAKTSVKKHTYEPEWNEQITFAELVRKQTRPQCIRFWNPGCDLLIRS